MSFKGTKEKWHLVEYPGFYVLQDGEFYEDASLFDAEHVGEIKAKANAELALSAPLLLDALQKIVEAQNKPGGTLASLNGAVWNAEKLLKELNLQ